MCSISGSNSGFRVETSVCFVNSSCYSGLLVRLDYLLIFKRMNLCYSRQAEKEGNPTE
jgi:hypothetical protein